MAQRLRTPDGIATYRQRGHIAETLHGHIKHNMGIRTLTRRGLRRAKAEWMFICTTYNLNRLQRTLRRNGHPSPAPHNTARPNQPARDTAPTTPTADPAVPGGPGPTIHKAISEFCYFETPSHDQTKLVR